MSGPHFEQLRTRLKGLGLGRVGMEKVKNSHKGRVVRKFRRRGCVVRNFRTREGVVRVLCENLSFLWFSKTESMVLKFCHKNEFAQGSPYNVRIPVKFALRFWEGTESMHFWKLAQKRIRTRDVLCKNFTQGEWVVRILLSLGFSLLFFLIFPCFHSSSFPT